MCPEEYVERQRGDVHLQVPIDLQRPLVSERAMALQNLQILFCFLREKRLVFSPSERAVWSWPTVSV